MKKLICLLGLLLLAITLHAQSYPEVEAAFKTFGEYQRTDDERIIDLYAKDVSVTFIALNGAEPRKTFVPPKVFFEILKSELQKKKGGNDKYTDIKVTAIDSGFRVDCTLIHSKSGLPSPYIQEYVKTLEGFKISKMIVTIPSPSTGSVVNN